jgi:nitrite reductase (NADH) small subunit
MPRLPAGRLADLPPGQSIEVMSGETPYLVCNTGGQIHGLEGTCPHHGAPLSGGALNGNYVVCPWHAWEFDCRTGECSFDASQRLAKYPVTVENGELILHLP